MPILGVGWILGLFAINKNTIVFEYAFAIINGLQVDVKTFLLVSFFFFVELIPYTHLNSQANLQEISLITFFHTFLNFTKVGLILSFIS